MDVIAEVEGAISDSLSASGLIESTISAIESSIAAVQTTLLEAQYLAAVTVIIAEFKGLVDVLMGSGELFIGFLESLVFFIPDAFDGIFALFTFAITWMMCLFQNIANMQTCLIYYLLEVFGQILYLPVRIILWIAYQVGFDLYPIETSAWNGVEELDRIIMGIVGFHISHFPKNIRDQCYNCKRLKVSALSKHAAPLVDDITNKMPELLMPGIMLIAKGGDELMHPFQY
jgi:hypothetical protein